MKLRKLFMQKRFLGLPIALLLVLGVVMAGGVYAALGGIPKLSQANDINLQKGLVGWWKLDGNTTDSTPYRDNGSVAGAASPGSDRSGQANKAYSFNGSTDYLTMPDEAALNFGTGDFAVSVWFKLNSITSGTQQVLCKRVGGSGNYEIQVSSSGQVLAYVGTGSLTASITVSAGSWYHAVLTRNAGTAYLYINNASVSAANTSSTTSTSALNIGKDATSANEFFGGNIDDVRVYNRALSADEVSALFKLYNSATSLSQGEKGLVNWWKLDGNANDSSPNRQNGTNNGATAATDRAGQANGALSFDGTSYITTYNPSPANLLYATSGETWSTSAWFSATSSASNLVILGRSGGTGTSATYTLYLTGGTLMLDIRGSYTTLATGYNDGNWHHVVMTWDGTTALAYVDGGSPITVNVGTISLQNYQICIGATTSSCGGNKFVGSIDDVRVYNRTLSSTEVDNLYKSYNSQISVGGSGQSGSVSLGKGLVADWSLNGNAKDATPYRSNGSVINAVLTTDRKGRTNSAYSFNGTSASITTSVSGTPLNIVGDMSICFWLNISNNANYQGIVSKGSPTEYEIAADFRTGATALSWRSTNATSTAFASFFNGFTGSWTHVCGVVSGTNLTVYRNSQSFGTQAIGTRSASSNVVTLGNRTGQSWYFSGSLDDVHIWNRALNSSEVSALYNEYR